LYAKKLECAGVQVRGVRLLGTIHDSVMLNPLAVTAPTIKAICLAQATLRKVSGTKEIKNSLPKW
jgi:acetyl esterase